MFASIVEIRKKLILIGTPIWGVLIWIYSSCLFYWIISGKIGKENRIKRNFLNWN